jgi:hypothetical protein
MQHVCLGYQLSELVLPDVDNVVIVPCTQTERFVHFECGSWQPVEVLEEFRMCARQALGRKGGGGPVGGIVRIASV